MNPWHRNSPQRQLVASNARNARRTLQSISGKVKQYEVDRATDTLAWCRVEATALSSEEAYNEFLQVRRINAKLTRTELEEPYSIPRQRNAWAAEIRDARVPYAGRHPWSYDDEAKARARVLSRKLLGLARRQIIKEV